MMTGRNDLQKSAISPMHLDAGDVANLISLPPPRSKAGSSAGLLQAGSDRLAP